MIHDRWGDSPATRRHREPLPARPLFRAPGALERARRYMTPRRWLCVALVAAALGVLALSGCATAGAIINEGPLTWRLTHEPIADVRIVCSEGEALQLMCRAMNGSQWAVYYGCAERDYHAGICRVYLECPAASWIEAHERRHCAGESH